MEFFKSYLQYKKFKSLPVAQREIIFYSEGDFQWQYFEKIIKILCKKDYKICYVTSDPKDRGLLVYDKNLYSFYIGSSFFLTLFFLNLDSKILLMSMPDLETYHIKRSKVANVHYAYIFHACVSTHMMYGPRAFDSFDSIFCVGPHHIAEIRKREEKLGLKQKLLLEHGYSRIDDIIGSYSQQNIDKKNILIAPSWGETALIETGECKKIITQLLQSGFSVTLRPHPETKKRSPQIIVDIVKNFSGNRNFFYDDVISSTDSLKNSSLMITDSSGVIFDYALGYSKPIIFIKKCYKIRNYDYQELGIDPVEITIRRDVGIDYEGEDYKNLCSVINDYIIKYESNCDEKKRIRDKYIFNVGNSAAVGANHIINILGTL